MMFMCRREGRGVGEDRGLSLSVQGVIIVDRSVVMAGLDSLRR